MSKVNFEAKHEYEFVKNFKLLQNLFVSVGINKVPFILLLYRFELIRSRLFQSSGS